MRYLRLQVSRGLPGQVETRLRWWYFDNGRPWLDRQIGQFGVRIMFVGEGVHDLDLGWQLRDGTPLSHEVAPSAEVPSGKHDFAGQPQAQRRLEHHNINFGDHRRIELVDRQNNRVLLALTLTTAYPDFLFNLLEELRQSYALQGIENFVETGTFLGHTSLHASYWFDQVYTIELSKDLHQVAQEELAYRPNVTCLQGDSGAVLPHLIKDLQGTSLFFLDGHWSGDHTVDWESSFFGGYSVDTAKIANPDLSGTEQQKPLKRELQAICAGHREAAVILMDDWHYLGGRDSAFVGHDWSELRPDALKKYFDKHPRTESHFPLSEHQYVWILKPLSTTAKTNKQDHEVRGSLVEALNLEEVTHEQQGHPVTYLFRENRTDWFCDILRERPHGIPSWYLLHRRKHIEQRAMKYADFGANIGATSLLPAKVGHHVLAVEAGPENAMLLQMAVARNGLHDHMQVAHMAAADRQGLVTFYEASAWGGITMPQEHADIAKATTVAAGTVAQILDIHRMRDVDVIKIDIEGGELAALTGFEEIAQENSEVDLVLESNWESCHLSGYAPQQIWQRMNDLGFPTYLLAGRKLTPVTPEQPQLGMVSDILATRKDHETLERLGFLIQPMDYSGLNETLERARQRPGNQAINDGFISEQLSRAAALGKLSDAV